MKILLVHVTIVEEYKFPCFIDGEVAEGHSHWSVAKRSSLAAFAGIQSGATASTVAITVAQKVWAAGSAICGGALRVLGMAVRFAFGPVGLIITALTIGAGLIIDNWDTVGPYFTALWSGITGTFQGAWDIIKGIVDNITGAVEWVGKKIDETPVLGSAKRGIGSAWDWAFGDDDEEQAPPTPQQTAAPGQPQTVGTTAVSPATSATPPAPPAQAMREGAQLPQRATPQSEPASPAKRPRGQSAEEQAVLQQLNAGGADADAMSGMGGTNVTIPMTFNVQGLDIEHFKRLIKECTSEFEAIARRAVDASQHNKVRTAHAQ